MQLLVMSDSHGDFISCEQAIRRHPQADYVIHLGDGEDDLNRVNNTLLTKRILRVKGNCSSYGSILRTELIQEICGKKIYCCHGHLDNVKNTRELLINHAAAEGCELALYGHTHIQRLDILPIPLQAFNPGSIRAGNYGIVEITPDSVVCHAMSL